LPIPFPRYIFYIVEQIWAGNQTLAADRLCSIILEGWIEMKITQLLLVSTFGFCVSASLVHAESQIEKAQIVSRNFEGNKIGIGKTRKFQVYLPDGYAGSSKRYPVLYFLHSFFEDENTFFNHQRGKKLFDQAITSGAIADVIVVTVDFSTPLGGSLFTNSPVTGNWHSFMLEELVPHIDRSYRTLSTRKSRGIFGHFIGGNGAIRFASRHPDVFGSVYALHPVGTGFGHLLMQSRPNWEKLMKVKSLDEIKGDGLSEIFSAIYQAHLPNPEKAPLYFDPPARMENGKLILDSALVEKVQAGFFLEKQVPEYAENMKKLIGFKFDWGRHDPNQDHVYSNQFYSRKLNEFGVPHEAEEYNGAGGSEIFAADGRIANDVMPFFQKHLTFGRPN
jgi:pimeloyl-ACP methyl ester carboxylesterase